jgi:hypothetical protein
MSVQHQQQGSAIPVIGDSASDREDRCQMDVGKVPFPSCLLYVNRISVLVTLPPLFLFYTNSDKKK